MPIHKTAVSVALGAGLIWSAGAHATTFNFNVNELGSSCYKVVDGTSSTDIFNKWEQPDSSNSNYYRYTCNYNPGGGKTVYQSATAAGNVAWDRGDTGTALKDNQSNSKLDFYVPKNLSVETLKTLPIVVYLHGGGQVAGNKRNADTVSLINRWVGSKAIVVSLNYTLRATERTVNGAVEKCGVYAGWPYWVPAPCSPIDLGQPYPQEQLQAYRDVANAVKWLTSYNGFSSQNVFPARTDGIYSEIAGHHRIVLMGHSAGGLYASAIATQPHWLRNAFSNASVAPNQVLAGVISLSSPMHFNTCGTTTDTRSNAPQSCTSLAGESAATVASKYPYLKAFASKLSTDRTNWNFRDLVPLAWNSTSTGAASTDGGYGDGAIDKPLWMHLSPLYSYVGRNTRSLTPPLLLINGGSGCTSPFNCAYDMGDPPVMSETAKILATQASAAAGEHVVAIQPVFKATKNGADCYAYPMHSGVRYMLSASTGWAALTHQMGLDAVTPETGNLSTNFQTCENTVLGSLRDLSVTLATANPLDQTVSKFIAEARGTYMQYGTISTSTSLELWKHPNGSVDDN